MTITIELPSAEPLKLEHLLLDINGTLTHDGVLLDGVANALASLSDEVSLRLLSADTFGTAQAIAQQLAVALEIVADGDQKRALVDQLGARRCAALGNGRNDVAMLRAAALGITVVGPEGASAQAVAAADVVCNSVLDALALLSNPARLTATLRP
jgi:P-type E1-E2 ATPase